MRKDLARLDTLRRLLILDSSPERAYDDIVTLLSTGLDVPIAMVNILDEERDWFKACVGFPATESPAVTSFCEAFFRSADELIVVEDTTQDARFQAHPLVVAAPFVRFYAAARLTVDGQTVGTLCAYDLAPKRLSLDQFEQLRTLAGAAMKRLSERTATA